jgi:cell division septation protein DedD
MLVQVSSQRSEDAARATFRDLQARYPSILGPYDVNIQRAEIPDRGTFYRVRVGPFSASDAQRLCNDLKTAGGDCILAQR